MEEGDAIGNRCGSARKREVCAGTRAAASAHTSGSN